MSSTSSVRDRGRDIQVKMVDYDDFPETGPDNVTGFFREVGALNSAFSKRFSQMMSLHPCTPLAETMDEYINHQQKLQEKYNVKLHVGAARASLNEPRKQVLEFSPPAVSENSKSSPVNSVVNSGNASKSSGFSFASFNSKHDSSVVHGSAATSANAVPAAKPISFPSFGPNNLSQGTPLQTGTGGFFGGSTAAGSTSLGTNSGSTPKLTGFSFLSSNPVPDSIIGGSSDGAAAKPISFPSFNPPTTTNNAPLTLGGFSFAGLGASKLPVLSLASGQNNEDADGDDDAEEADPVPVVPVEDQEVVESDAIASKRCHVFYLDSGTGTFVKRGTGTAHVKLLDGVTDAVQIVVRAGTSLGAILLNTRVSKTMKATRVSQGSGDKTTESVRIVCHAVPAFKGADPAKLYQFTLKFKDKGEADDFYKAIESHI